MSRTAGARIRNGAWLIVAAYLVAAVAWKWPSWWLWIAPEAAPSRELSTLLLLSCAAVSASGARSSFTARWLCLSTGFAVLAADERMAIHERLRDRLLAPNGVDLPFVPWAQPGDIVLVVVAVVGLAAVPWLYAVFRGRAEARAWFVLAIVLALIAVGLDTLPIETYSIAAERRFQTGEEVIELAAAASFLSAVLGAHREREIEIASPQPPTAPAGSAPPRSGDGDRMVAAR